jgi:hypothetical protein
MWNPVIVEPYQNGVRQHRAVERILDRPVKDGAALNGRYRSRPCKNVSRDRDNGMAMAEGQFATRFGQSLVYASR